MKRILKSLNVLLLLGIAGFTVARHGLQDPTGTLTFTVLDDATGQPVPCRIELLDAKAKAYVAEDAIPVGGD